MARSADIRVEQRPAGYYAYIQPRWDRQDRMPPTAALERFLRAFFIGHPAEAVQGSPYLIIEPLSALLQGNAKAVRSLFALDLTGQVRATPSYRIDHRPAHRIACVQLPMAGDEDPLALFDPVFEQVRSWARETEEAIAEYCRIGLVAGDRGTEVVFEFALAGEAD